MTEWQPIETAPKDGTVIIMTNGLSVEAGAYAPYINGDEFPWAFVDDYTAQELESGYTGVVCNGFRSGSVTHWMPLPAPPRVNGND